MNEARFIKRVAERTGYDRPQAEALTYVVFQELRQRITHKEALDVADQLPEHLRMLWLENERFDRDVERIHRPEFLAHVQALTVATDQAAAERAVKAVFATLQEALGSSTGTDGESWDIFSQLPKDLKQLWLHAHPGSTS